LKIKSKKNLLAYFGHHKCASLWTGNILKQVCNDLGLRFTKVHNIRLLDEELAPFILKNKIDFLSYVNADINHVKTIKNFKGFHIIRDPRDIAISAYFSHLYSHGTSQWPGLIAHREKLKNASKDDGIFLSIDFRIKEYNELYNWDYNQENVLELKMEDMISAPYEILVNALSFLDMIEYKSSLKKRSVFLISQIFSKLNSLSKGIFPVRFFLKKIPVEILLNYIYQNRFQKKSGGRKRGQENKKNHFRKGIAGDWKNHFNKEHRKYFKKKFNDLLVKLGYEKDSNW